jgi:hypothetical protein
LEKSQAPSEAASSGGQAEYAAPDGAWKYFGCEFYKDFAPARGLGWDFGSLHCLTQQQPG